MTRYLVSVIIPTYNRGYCLCEAIDSVLAQTYTNIEIIVVDDGSTDSTEEILKKYGPEIQYLWQENQGVSSARNLGIRAAKGEWIAFLDSDDEWLPNKLERQLEELRKCSGLVAHATNSLLIHSGRELSLFALRGKPDFARDGCVIIRPLITVFSMQFFTPSIIARKSALLKAGLFDVSMTLYEDLDCLARVVLLGPLGVTNEKLTIVKRKGDTVESLSSQHVQDKSKSFRSMLHIFNKLLQRKDLLSKQELHYVMHGASSNLFEIALVCREDGSRKKSFHLFLKSVWANPRPKAVFEGSSGDYSRTWRL